MKKYLIIICVVALSCGKKQSHEEEYYQSGNIKTSNIFEKETGKLIQRINYYDLNGEKKFNTIFYKVSYDSVAYFYDNGKPFKTGKQDKKGNLYGKWNYYTREGLLSDCKEFFIINNKFDKGYRLNQVWYFDKKKDTMPYGNNKFNIYNQKEFENESKGEKTSIFVRFFYYPKGDTISISEPLRCIAEDGFPFWEKKNSESYVVLAKEKYNFNKDFSNEKEVKADTFYCLEKDKANKGSMPEANQKHTVTFGRWFDMSGKKVLRGYMVEHYNRKPTQGDNRVSQERRTYFEKIIYVKDTIKK